MAYLNEYRRCNKCHKMLTYSHFYKDKSRVDGIRYTCKKCSNTHHTEWIKKNKKAHSITRSNYHSRKTKNDIEYRISHNMRNRIRNAVIRDSGSRVSIRDLGCTISDFKKHIESKFVYGMSWNNYGEWEIDHIRPVASFNLKNKAQVKECFSYINTQPLFKEDNMKKGCKL